MSAMMIPAGECLLGRVINFRGDPIDGLGPIGETPKLPLDRPLQTPTEGRTSAQLLETGVKVIDLLVPFARGGSMHLCGPSGAGKLVFLGELVHNMATHHNGCAVLVGVEERTYEIKDLMRVLRELGVNEKTVVVFSQRHDPPATQQQAVRAGLTIAEHFRDQGREVLLCVDTKLALTSEMRSGQGSVGATKRGAISLILFEPSDDDSDTGEGAASSHADTRVRFDRPLIAQGLLPPIDPLASTSRMLEPQIVGKEHAQVALQVRQVLQRERDLRTVIETRGMEQLSDADRQLVAQARRMQRFLTQPFYVAEIFTGIPGEYVTLRDTLNGFNRLGEGYSSDLPERAFYMVGAIDQAVEKAKDP